MSYEELKEQLRKTTLSIPEAGAIFDMSRNAAYLAAANGTFPVPIIRAGGKLRVSTAAIRRVLGLDEVAA